MIRPLGAVLTESELAGVPATSDWSRWIASGRAPSSGDGTGYQSTWADDLAQLALLGFNEVAVTLECHDISILVWPSKPSGSMAGCSYHCSLRLNHHV